MRQPLCALSSPVIQRIARGAAKRRPMVRERPVFTESLHLYYGSSIAQTKRISFSHPCPQEPYCFFFFVGACCAAHLRSGSAYRRLILRCTRPTASAAQRRLCACLSRYATSSSK